MKEEDEKRLKDAHALLKLDEQNVLFELASIAKDRNVKMGHRLTAAQLFVGKVRVL